MPLYEYLCHSCGKKFEVIEKFSDPPLKTHENCGGEVERLISAPAFHFKGSGWYVTDYAKGNSGAPKSDGGKSDAAETKTAETKTDTKPAAESKPAPAATSTESK